MRDLARNQQAFYYALYQGKTEVTDSQGYKTGEKKLTYSDPVLMKANISPSTGYTDVAVFGKDIRYSKTFTTCDMSCPITETSILWIDKEPYDDEGNLTAHNYIVKRIAKGLDNIMFAIDKVELR